MKELLVLPDKRLHSHLIPAPSSLVARTYQYDDRVDSTFSLTKLFAPVVGNGFQYMAGLVTFYTVTAPRAWAYIYSDYSITIQCLLHVHNASAQALPLSPRAKE